MPAPDLPIEERITRAIVTAVGGIDAAQDSTYWYTIQHAYVAQESDVATPSVFPTAIITAGATSDDAGRTNLAERDKDFAVLVAVADANDGAQDYPTLAANKAIYDVHRVIAANRKWGGDAIHTTVTGWDYELPVVGDSITWALINFRVRYRHDNNDLTVSR